MPGKQRGRALSDKDKEKAMSPNKKGTGRALSNKDKEKAMELIAGNANRRRLMCGGEAHGGKKKKAMKRGGNAKK